MSVSCRPGLVPCLRIIHVPENTNGATTFISQAYQQTAVLMVMAAGRYTWVRDKPQEKCPRPWAGDSQPSILPGLASG